jgi:hypothetical protein
LPGPQAASPSIRPINRVRGVGISSIVGRVGPWERDTVRTRRPVRSDQRSVGRV